MLWLMRFVGSPKLFIPVASALLVGLILYTMIQYGENKAEVKQTIQDQKEYIKTRKEIDRSVESVDDISPDAALEWLLQRRGRE